jgi:hypothetical protein
VYSRAPDALASHEQQWAIQFAQQASQVLLATNPTATAESVEADIHEALLSREIIALAQGVIMTRQRLRPDAALRFLMDVSRQTSRPLLGICHEVVKATAPAGKDATSDISNLRGRST